MSVPPPEGYRTVSAFLIAPEAEEVLAFAQAVFGAAPAKPALRAPGGRLINLPLAVGDSMVMLAAPMDGQMRQTAMLHVYVQDCDATHRAALAAGATEMMAPADQWYGDRAAGVRDMAGNIWWIATRKESPDHDELTRRAAAEKGR